MKRDLAKREERVFSIRCILNLAAGHKKREMQGSFAERGPEA